MAATHSPCGGQRAWSWHFRNRGVVAIRLTVEQAETKHRSDAGRVRLSGRDVHGLVLCGEQFAAQYDILASALEV
jgi:hypothetical protein